MENLLFLGVPKLKHNTVIFILLILASDKGRPGYQIIYFVEEKRLFSGGINTLVGQNDANLVGLTIFDINTGAL